MFSQFFVINCNKTASLLYFHNDMEHTLAYKKNPYNIDTMLGCLRDKSTKSKTLPQIISDLENV